MLGDCASVATCVAIDSRSDPTSSRCQISRTRALPRGLPTDAKDVLCGRAEFPTGGARRDRTDDLLLAKQALSQLSYGPSRCRRLVRVVGLGRFELPTSRLSSARSNQLSYRPGKRGGRPNEERETKAAVSRKRAGSWRFIDSHMFLSTGKERNRDGLPRTSWHP